MGILGITGHFASGKTFILDILKLKGYKCFNVDKFVYELYLDDSFKSEIYSLFPTMKKLRKPWILKRIMNSTLARRKLEKLIHPRVAEAIKAFIASSEHKGKLAFIEVPLLFEAKFQKYFDFIIMVSCSKEASKTRALGRPGIKPKLYQKIKFSQLSIKKKILKSDFVVYSDLNEPEIINQIDKILASI